MRDPLFLCPGPDIKPNLWMWVNPNMVYPPGKLEVAVKEEDQSALSAFQPALKEEEDSCSEASEVQQPLPPCRQKRKQRRSTVPLPLAPGRRYGWVGTGAKQQQQLGF
jgi:hypothetical protein